MKPLTEYCRASWFAHCAALLLLGLLSPPSHSFGFALDPIPMTRNADVIIVGLVAKLNDNSIEVRVDQVLKGRLAAPVIEIEWDRQPKWEFTPAVYRKGERLLVFLKSGATIYAPVNGPVGTVDLDAEDAGPYPNLVSKIVDFDRASDADAKGAVIQELLARNDKVSRINGLHLIIDERKKKRATNAQLKVPVSKLINDGDAQVSANAIQALGHIGDGDSVPALINLLGSPNGNVAKAAHAVLKRWTGANIELNSKASPKEREASVQKWRGWWEKNAGKVRPRH